MEYIVLVVSAIIIPLILFIYSLISYKKKIIICTINNNKMKIMKNSYYNLQLLFCIINCILLVFESVLTIDNIILFVCYYIATFWLMNYLLKFISIKMKYVSIGYE
jgi:hypothetical protein